MFLFFGASLYCFFFVLCMSTCDTTLTVMEVPLGYCIVCSWPVDLVNTNHWLPRGFHCISNGTLTILSVLAGFWLHGGCFFLPMSGCTGDAQVWYGLSVRRGFGTRRHTPLFCRIVCENEGEGRVQVCLLSIEYCWW